MTAKTNAIPRPAYLAHHTPKPHRQKWQWGLKNLAEVEGFEPPDSFLSLVFKTSAFGRSATLPRYRWVR